MDSYFWLGEVLDNFLVKGLNTKSWAGIAGVCVALISLSVLYESLHKLKQFFLSRFLKARRRLRKKYHDSGQVTSRVPSSSSRLFLSRRRTNNIQDTENDEPAPRSLLEQSDHHEVEIRNLERRSFIDLGISSILHSVYVFLGFTLMNAVMTFNVWVLVAILIGFAIGYFCFGNYRKEDNLMHPLLGTETTSLNEDSSVTPPVIDGAGDRDTSQPYFGQFRVPILDQERHTEGENTRLIVGAEIHTPRISSVTSTGST